MIKKTLKFVVAVLLCAGAAWLGSYFTMPAIGDWYGQIAKPSFNPPNWIFAPVWTVLYFLMAVSLYLVWQSPAKNKKTAILYFLLQLALNILWSALFFGGHQLGLAFGEIVVLWLTILLTISAFAKISRTAAWLLLPYLLWVSFAAFLNFSIWRLN